MNIKSFRTKVPSYELTTFTCAFIMSDNAVMFNNYDIYLYQYKQKRCEMFFTHKYMFYLSVGFLRCLSIFTVCLVRHLLLNLKDLQNVDSTLLIWDFPSKVDSIPTSGINLSPQVSTMLKLTSLWKYWHFWHVFQFVQNIIWERQLSTSSEGSPEVLYYYTTNSLTSVTLVCITPLCLFRTSEMWTMMLLLFQLIAVHSFSELGLTKLKRIYGTWHNFQE